MKDGYIKARKLKGEKMSEDLSKLSSEELLKKYREAVAYTALSNNGADKDCLATETKYAAEVERRLKEWQAFFGLRFFADDSGFRLEDEGRKDEQKS